MFNFTLLKPYFRDIVPAWDPIKLDNGPEYDVNSILYHWWVDQWHNNIEYLVSFVGYDASHNDWLPAANLANALDILLQYQTLYGLY